MKYFALALLISLTCNASECTDLEWNNELAIDGDVTTEDWENIVDWCDSHEEVKDEPEV